MANYSFNSFDLQFRRLADEYDSIEVTCGDNLISVDLEDVPYQIEVETEDGVKNLGTAKSIDGLVSIFWLQIEEIGDEWSFVF